MNILLRTEQDYFALSSGKKLDAAILRRRFAQEAERIVRLMEALYLLTRR